MINSLNKHGPVNDPGIRTLMPGRLVAASGQPPPWRVVKCRSGPETGCIRSIWLQEMSPGFHALGWLRILIRGALSPDELSAAILWIGRPIREGPARNMLRLKRRRWRSHAPPLATIAGRRPGESPPGSVVENIYRNIDSLFRRKRTIRGWISYKEQTAEMSVMGEVCTVAKLKSA